MQIDYGTYIFLALVLLALALWIVAIYRWQSRRKQRWEIRVWIRPEL